jgi:TonB family protein
MRFIYLTLFFLVSSVASAQKIAVIYYDADWDITTKSEASYYRTCIIDTANQSFHGGVKDYYMNGKLHMTGVYVNHIKVDSFFFYYPTGALESKGLYVDNVRWGTWKYFHKNGKLKQVADFSEVDFLLKEYYDSAGNALLPDGTGVWHNEYKLANQLAWLRIEGEYQHWKKDGKWKVFMRNGNEERLDHTDKFKEGELKGPWYSGTFASVYLPEHLKFYATERFYHSVFVSKKNYPYIKKLPKEIDSLGLPYDTEAEFPGGEKELHRFIKKNLNYPAEAKHNSVEAQISVQFTIDKNGNITNIDVDRMNFEKSAGEYGFLREVERLVRLFPKWVPATRKNEHVAQRQYLTIHFEIKEIKVNNLRSMSSGMPANRSKVEFINKSEQ